MANPDLEYIFPNAKQLDAQNAILNRIANKLGAYEEPLTWAALQAQVRAGNVGLYLQPGDQVEVDHSSMVTASVSGEGITAASVDKDKFLAAAGTGSTDYEFGFDGTWHYGGTAVTLADYGITAAGTAITGDIIVVHRTAATYDFDVCGLDEMQTVNEDLKHNLSILMHNVYSTVNFDVPQYLFPVTAESLTALGISGSVLPAGTYNVTLDHGAFAGGTEEDTTYQFTTTQDVPIGGGIRHTTIGGMSHVTGGTFVTYGADTFTVIESGLATTEGNSGTSLGTTTARDPQYKSDYINFSERQLYGSNRWSTSWLRQLLNSDDAVLQWKPATIWSRNLNITPEGYLHAIDPELRAVLAKVRVRYALSVTEGYGYEDIEDYVTLETMMDVYGSANNSIYEGPVTKDGTVKRTTYSALWKDAAQEDKIKRHGTTSRFWWLSSSYPPIGYYERYVHTSGSLQSNGALNPYGVVPRLTIA